MIETMILGNKYMFETNDDVFSPSSVDKGTLAMLAAVKFNPFDKILDLGCGYGAVGIYASSIIDSKNIVMCDISSNAVNLAKVNAKINNIEGMTIVKSNGFDKVTDYDFTMILSNPPYHSDFSIAKHFIEESYKRLEEGGRLIMVTKRLEWYKNKMTAVFGGVSVTVSDGYYVFISEKRKRAGINKTNKKMECLKNLKGNIRWHKRFLEFIYDI